MKLAHILQADLINLTLQATSKEEAFIELIDMAVKEHGLNKNALYDAVMEREKQQSTYMGHSLAMPHARIDDLRDFIIVCGRSEGGITFDEASEPVRMIVLILSCKTKINVLLQTMAAFAEIFSDDALLKKLDATKNSKDASVTIVAPEARSA